jgi:hypothetical protein
MEVGNLLRFTLRTAPFRRRPVLVCPAASRVRGQLFKSNLQEINRLATESSMDDVPCILSPL